MTEAPVSERVPDATTRYRVMKFVIDHGWTTAARLASEFGLTAAAIRRHLSHLELTGMLAVRTRPVSLRKGAGRPAKEYSATSQGRQVFSQGYDTLAIQAVETLRAIGGDDAVRQFFEARFDGIQERFERHRVLDPRLTEAEALSLALTEDGFASGLLPLASGAQLCQYNCPYPAVAAHFPELCAVETSLFSRLLRSHVQRLATIAHGDGVCTTHIPSATRKEDR